MISSRPENHRPDQTFTGLQVLNQLHLHNSNCFWLFFLFFVQQSCFSGKWSKIGDYVFFFHLPCYRPSPQMKKRQTWILFFGDFWWRVERSTCFLRFNPWVFVLLHSVFGFNHGMWVAFGLPEGRWIGGSTVDMLLTSSNYRISPFFKHRSSKKKQQ